MKHSGYIKKELVKIYGVEKAGRIAALGQGYYRELSLMCQGASKGELFHLENTILPTASFYRALLELDSENALRHTSSILLGLCEAGGNALSIILKFPGMKAVFMKLLSKMGTKMFGPECGFEYTNFKAAAGSLQMDMTKCPYLKYANMLNVPELAPLFCESDFATYGKLPGIEFRRNETLGTGGQKCDFRFLRTN